MGTWGAGPFGNDTAADFAGDLDDLPEQDRPAAIRDALSAAVAEGEYLGVATGDTAVAAAAIVAAQCAGGPPIATAYGPKEAIPPLPADLRSLAVQALDRVVGENSESAALWTHVGGQDWREQIHRLREALSDASL
ncbi:DUF4259 domain-containing protein [Actinomadura rupiterrae]|uniref:DUF4259 domain-containing protein n=1 Tax=Actinomadura rupiterrae TaxID=559627 RepID=UPI0020A52376|nr:DUF4259 domain-containing protein [Actinomadura rupiterrae]